MLVSMRKACPISNKLIVTASNRVEQGVPWDLVAGVGVSVGQMRRWIKIGKEMDDAMLRDGAYPPNSGQLEWQAHKLYQELEEAQKQFVIRNIRRINKAAVRSWVAARCLLEMRAREYFGRNAEATVDMKAGPAQVSAQVHLYIPSNGRETGQ